MPKFVQRHQSQLYLLPPDLRDWLPEERYNRILWIGVVRQVAYPST